MFRSGRSGLDPVDDRVRLSYLHNVCKDQNGAVHVRMGQRVAAEIEKYKDWLGGGDSQTKVIIQILTIEFSLFLLICLSPFLFYFTHTRLPPLGVRRAPVHPAGSLGMQPLEPWRSSSDGQSVQNGHFFCVVAVKRHTNSKNTLGVYVGCVQQRAIELQRFIIPR